MTANVPILAQVNLVASDFDATVDFYRRLGLDLSDQSPPDGTMRHAEVHFENGLSLDVDDTRLARIYNSAWREGVAASHVLINFTMRDRHSVDEKYKELVESGYASRQVPYDTFWGARYAIVGDPDGNDIGIMSPLDESRRYWPPTESPGS